MLKRALSSARYLALLFPLYAIFVTAQVGCGGLITNDVTTAGYGGGGDDGYGGYDDGYGGYPGWDPNGGYGGYGYAGWDPYGGYGYGGGLIGYGGYGYGYGGRYGDIYDGRCHNGYRWAYVGGYRNSYTWVPCGRYGYGGGRYGGYP